MKIGFWPSKLLSKIFHNHEILLDYYRRGGVSIGHSCLICSKLLFPEGFLLSIGDKTTISTNVHFVLHDYSAHNVMESKSSLYGKISIGNNCFIGMDSIILYGVTLGDNTIVAAGSVVTKSFEQTNVVIGGNPAKVISTWDNYIEKYEQLAAPCLKDIGGFNALYRKLKEGCFLISK